MCSELFLTVKYKETQVNLVFWIRISRIWNHEFLTEKSVVPVADQKGIPYAKVVVFNRSLLSCKYTYP